jgi:HEAT repeat protein
VLAAVPSGEYEITVSIDLTPVFGKLELAQTRQIERPSADAFERRLKDLASEDPKVRRKAVAELPYFGAQRKRVGPAIVACLSDPDGIVRRMALATLQGFAKEAAEHADTILRILEDRNGRARGERTNAALLISRTTPPSDRALAALEGALKDAASEWDKKIFQSALDAYRKRCTPAEKKD